MRRNISHLQVLLVLGLITVSGWASAELQNAIVNGTYGMKEESRVVKVFPVALDDSGNAADHIRMEMGEPSRRGNCSAAGLQDVAIPAFLTPDSYQDQVRVFLSLYVGRPAGPSGKMDFAVTVSGFKPFVPTYRVYTGFFTEPGWHPIIIDVGPWAGQVVNLSFQAAWLDGDAQEIILGLPRLVACHGPASDGGGGMRMGPFYHGMGSIGPKSGVTFHLDGTLLEGGPLAIRRFDVIEPSTLDMQSAVQEYTARLSPGLHWLPLQLPVHAECELNAGCIEGTIQHGPIDIIPNFMANDKGRLEGIVKDLDPALNIPMSPLLFKSPSPAPSGP